MGIREERDKRVKWFMNDRFGMFIHWGLYSIPAVGEWKRSYERISLEEYEMCIRDRYCTVPLLGGSFTS